MEARGDFGPNLRSCGGYLLAVLASPRANIWTTPSTMTSPTETARSTDVLPLQMKRAAVTGSRTTQTRFQERDATA